MTPSHLRNPLSALLLVAAPAGADLGPNGDALVLPTPQTATSPWEQSLAGKLKEPFGAVNVSETAMVEGNLVGWEERSTTKQQMYKNILGLNPPKNRVELCICR